MCEALTPHIVSAHSSTVLHRSASTYAKNINGIDEYIHRRVKQFPGKLPGMSFLRTPVKIDLDTDLLDIIKETRYPRISLFPANAIKINHLVYT